MHQVQYIPRVYAYECARHVTYRAIAPPSQPATVAIQAFISYRLYIYTRTVYVKSKEPVCVRVCLCVALVRVSVLLNVLHMADNRDPYLQLQQVKYHALIKYHEFRSVQFVNFVLFWPAANCKCNSPLFERKTLQLLVISFTILYDKILNNSSWQLIYKNVNTLQIIFKQENSVYIELLSLHYFFRRGRVS